MERIRQEFIVDAAQAIANLANFDAALRRVDTTLGNMGGGARTAAQGISEADTTVRNANRSTRELTVSWQTLSRVFQTQVIVGVIGQIRREFTDAAEQAFEFQRQVALIQTLRAPEDLNVGFDQIADAVRAIASENNIPLLEASTAAYNALSNQVGNVSETLQFTSEAATFARITNSSLADSVDLLSAAMRAYGLDVSDTAQLSSTFFTIIDRGRIEADELANSFGRIGAPAAALGVSLDELGTVLSIVSDRGFTTAETTTQLRGILNTLNRPSEALTEALRDIGFESPVVAQQVLGLTGTLQALNDSVGGSTEALGELFPNVRASSGVFALLSAGIEGIDETLSAFRDTTQSFSSERELLVAATDSDVVSSALNRLRIEGEQAGEQFLSLAADAVRFVESIDGAESFLISLASNGTIAAVALSGVAAATLGATAAFGALAANPLALTLIATAGAIAAVSTAIATIRADQIAQATFELDQFNEELERTVRIRRAELNGDLFDADTGEGLGTTQITSALRLLSRDIGALITEAQQRYNEGVQGIIIANDILVERLEGAGGEVLDIRQDIVERLAEEAESIDDLQRESQQRIQGLQQGAVELDFELSIGNLPELAQAVELQREAGRLARTSAADLSNAGTDEVQIQQALAGFDRATDLADRARGIAESANNRGLELQAVQQIQRITQQQISAERSLQQVQESRREAINAEQQAQQDIVDQIREQIALANANTGDFQSDGTRFTESEIAERDRLRREALQRASELATERTDLGGVGDLLGIGQSLQDARSDLSRNPIALGVDFQDSIDDFRQRLEQLDVTATVNIRPFLEQAGAFAEANGEEAPRTPAELARSLVDQTEQINELQRNVAAIGVLSTTLAEIEAQINSNPDFGQNNPTTVARTADLGALITGELRAANTADNRAREALVLSTQQIEQALNGQITTQQLRDFLGEFRDGPGDVGDISNNALAAAVSVRIQELELVLQSLDTQDQIAEQETQQTVNANGLGTPIEAVNTLFDTAQLSGSELSTSMSDAAVEARRIRDFFRQALPDVVNRQFGGLMFNNGGTARGVDTIPAMLSPGESVITPQATSRFFSQIQAMNAGQEPTFRAQNGGTTTIGDISVNVQGGDTGVATARTIAQELRRQARRGNI